MKGIINHLKKLGLVLGIILLGVTLNAQSNSPFSREEMDKSYEKNIKKARVNGVYIPVDFDDAFEEFKHLADKESLSSFTNYEEDVAANKLHFGLGRWMIVNWSFYEGSRLSHYLREKGLLHPDDMASYLIRMFHRKLNGKELNDEALISSYSMKRKIELRKKGSLYFDKREDK